MSEIIDPGAHWEVTRAKNAGQKDNPHGGQFDKWYVGLKNLDGRKDCDDAYWQRKAPSEVSVGDKVYGKLEKGDYGFRFYMEKEPDGGGSFEVQSGAEGGKTGRNLDHSIARQVALKVLSPAICNAGGLTPELRHHVEEMEGFILEAGQAASASARNEAGASSSQSASPGSASPPAEERTDVEMALSEPPGGKFLAGEARELITSYMLSRLQGDDLLRACNQLTNSADQNQQEQTLRAMRQRTERWKGERLPADTDADEVPF